MSWDRDLWDQYNSLSNYAHRGTEFLEQYGTFVDKRSRMEQEYALKLKQLTKEYRSRQSYNAEEDNQELTSNKAFRNLLKQQDYIANQHEIIAEKLNSLLVNDLTPFVKVLKEDKK